MDPLLLMVQAALAALGVLGVATAAPELAAPQAVRAGAAIALTVLASRLRPRHIVRVSPYAYVVTLTLLILALVVGVTSEGSESRRWILLPGGLALQPSELMKVVVIAYLTAFFHNHLGDWQIWRPMLVIGLAAGLVVVAPDVSTALFLFVLAFGIMVAAGISLVRLASITSFAMLCALAVSGLWLSRFTYIQDRLRGYLDVLLGGSVQADTISYQALRARTALERGGWVGVGPGRPVYVPEADTDFVAVSIAQSLGLVGVLLLMGLYALVAVRGYRIATLRDGPGSLLAAGATAYICGQAALNLSVASGVFPITGVALPMVSYGLNSLLSVSLAFAFLHVAHREARDAAAGTGGGLRGRAGDAAEAAGRSARRPSALRGAP